MEQKESKSNDYQNQTISGINEYTLDIKLLPKFLGHDIPERIENWLKYRQLGLILIDTSNE